MSRHPKSWFFAAALLVAAASGRAVTLDRIAVVVGKRVIKTSDIDRDLRLTAFLNRQPLDFTSKARRESAGRLVDQELIRQEIATGGYRRPPDTEGATLETELVRDRFHGSEPDYRNSLERYGVTPAELRAELLWQVTVLQFIDQRFRGGVFVSDDQVQQYCQAHGAELRKQNPGASAKALEKTCRDTLEGQQVNQNFDAWLGQQRKSTRIEYKPEAFA